jgi:2,6-dihydroxypseudooxynicotine hydrolase
MTVKGGRLELLAPHMLRSQLLRPGFVRLSLRLGVARQMPPWAKLQFINSGVAPRDLDRVLGRITSLESWVDEWESLAREHEQGGADALELGRPADAARRWLAASSAYNFAQYVIFLNIERKRRLHDACVRAYARAAPLFDPPARILEVTFRRQAMQGYLRLPKGATGPVPVVVLVNGTNSVKEELHWWGEGFLERGIAVLTFDGPGLGRTFHRLSMVAEPRPVGVAIMNAIASRPELDPDAVAFCGNSLGGYMVIRMASHEPRVRAVAAVCPPYSASVYWNITLSGMRRELAALYNMEEREMAVAIDRITLADVLPSVRCPLLVVGAGHDLITPGSESWRIFEDARCERELIYYPRAMHDCFNVMADLRPRLVGWVARQLARHQQAPRPTNGHVPERDSTWQAAEAVDPDFGDALRGDSARIVWNRSAAPADARRRWPWSGTRKTAPEFVHRLAPATQHGTDRPIAPHAPDTPDTLPI